MEERYVNGINTFNRMMDEQPELRREIVRYQLREETRTPDYKQPYLFDTRPDQ